MDFKFPYSLEHVRKGLPIYRYIYPRALQTETGTDVCNTHTHTHTHAPDLLLELDYFLNQCTLDFRTCASTAKLSKHPEFSNAIQQEQNNTTPPIRIREIISPKTPERFQNLHSDRGC